MRSIKNGISSNRIKNLMDILSRQPVYHTIKYIYPRLYRIDNLESDQYDLIKDQKLKENQILKNIGHTSTISNFQQLKLITKPYMFALSYDDIYFESKINKIID